MLAVDTWIHITDGIAKFVEGETVQLEDGTTAFIQPSNAGLLNILFEIMLFLMFRFYFRRVQDYTTLKRHHRSCHCSEFRFVE